MAQAFVVMVGFDVEVALGAGVESRLGLGLGMGGGVHLPPCGEHVDESHEVNRAGVEESADKDGGNHHAQKLIGAHNIPTPVGATWHVHGLPGQRGMAVGGALGMVWESGVFGVSSMTCDMWGVRLVGLWAECLLSIMVTITHI